MRGLSPHRAAIAQFRGSTKKSDIIEKQFNRAFWGYDIVEVDQFLDEIVKELEHMEQENKLLELRNQMLLDRMARDGVSLSEEDKK